MFDVATVQPFSAIIGAAMTATASFLIAYFLVFKRKKIEIRVLPPEELTRALQGHNRVIAVSVDGQPFLALNRCTVLVRNTGNTNIDKFSFTVEIPGEHKGYLCDVSAHNREVHAAINVSAKSSSYSPTFNVAVETFFNPGEEFKIVMFFDQELAWCNIQCRIPDTKVTVKYGAPLFDYRHAGWKAKVFAIFFGAFIAMQAGVLIFLVAIVSYSIAAKAVALWHFLVNLQ